jgi:hypothetical protein
MKRLIALAAMVLMGTAMSLGCSDKASTTKKTTQTGPGGTTTTEQTETVKKSGENPPAANP